MCSASVAHHSYQDADQFVYHRLSCRRRTVWHWRRHTHTRLMALCPGLPGWAGTRKVKPIWILMKQETVSGSGSGISWGTCKSAPRSRQITKPAPTLSFLQAGCPSCHPNNSVKSTEGTYTEWEQKKMVNILVLYRSHLTCFMLNIK